MIFCAWMPNQKTVFWMENDDQSTPKVTQQILDWCVGATLQPDPRFKEEDSALNMQVQ